MIKTLRKVFTDEKELEELDKEVEKLTSFESRGIPYSRKFRLQDTVVPLKPAGSMERFLIVRTLIID